MGKLNIELCPETGICTIVKTDGTKVDLMPDEVDSLRAAAAQPESVRQTIADVDVARPVQFRSAQHYGRAGYRVAHAGLKLGESQQAAQSREGPGDARRGEEWD